MAIHTTAPVVPNKAVFQYTDLPVSVPSMTALNAVKNRNDGSVCLRLNRLTEVGLPNVPADGEPREKYSLSFLQKKI